MKSMIRKEILTKRKLLADEMIRQNSDIITHKIICHPAYQKAKLILGYIDAKGEVKTNSLIEDAWRKGKKVAVPKVHGEIMHFHMIESFDQLKPGKFGIMEPVETCQRVDLIPEDTLVIMPGVAFDRNGNRIGYGKGYYDKYFCQYTDVYKIAIAFEIQIVDTISVDEYDIQADEVITEL